MRAKNVHEGLPEVDKFSYVDLNRAGTPLGEIVTAPELCRYRAKILATTRHTVYD